MEGTSTVLNMQFGTDKGMCTEERILSSVLYFPFTETARSMTIVRHNPYSKGVLLFTE